MIMIMIIIIIIIILIKHSFWMACWSLLKDQVMPVTLGVQDFAKDSGCTQ